MYMHTSEGRGRKPATVKDIIMATGGECEIPGELPTSCPITSSPAMPILHMNSHSIWGALLRLVNRPLRHKKGHPQATQSLRAAFCSLPVLNGSHRFLQSLFSYHFLLRYACLIHMNSHPIWGALLHMVDRRLHHKKKASPSNSKISCKPSFPITSSSAMPVFHLPHCSLSCPHRSHRVLRDTHLPFTSNTISMATRDAHLPFWRSSNHFSCPVVPLSHHRHELPPLVEDALDCVLSPS